MAPVPTYDDGGGIVPSATVPAGPPQMLGASPAAQQLYQRYAQMPLNQLQRLAVMMPPGSAQGQMVQRAMKAKQMAPASNGAFPTPAQTMPAVSGAATPIAGYASGGGAKGDAPAQGSPGGGSTNVSAIVSPGYGIAIPQVSYTPSATGRVGPTWSPGQALLSPTTPITTSPPGFGGTPATPPLVTPLPASVLNASAPAPAPAAPTLTSATVQAALKGFSSPMPTDPNAISAWQNAPSGISGLTNGQVFANNMETQAINNIGLRRGGLVPHLAGGGFPSVAPDDAMAVSTNPPQGARSLYHPGGFIHSPVGGRTDHLALSVPNDAHIIPADVVSGIGQGNGLNGGALLDAIFHSGPWGVKAQKVAGARPRFPNAPPPAQFAAGGRPERTTDIMAAGGEYVARPEAVAFFGRAAKRLARGKLDRKGDMQAGHDAIDAFILRARRHAIATMRKLPGPVKG